MRAEDTWTIAGGRALALAPFAVMGIVNVTPDSFSDGGAHDDAAGAALHARELFARGAALLDVGGESTRPFAPPVGVAEECARVVPVVAGLAADLPGAAISVDTYKAATAWAALDAGAHIVNDVSACAFDPELLDVVAQYKPGYVLMHSQGRPGTMQIDPRYDDVVEDVAAFFESGLAMLVRAGLPENRVVLDPGIGFGKTLEHNLALLAGLRRFCRLGRPLLVGVSRKTLFGQLLGLDVAARDPATQVASALALERGALIHRVHDVAGAVAALTLARAVAAGRP